jgi:hypothetical protein
MLSPEVWRVLTTGQLGQSEKHLAEADAITKDELPRTKGATTKNTNMAIT